MAMQHNRRVRGPFLFAATVLRPTCRLRPLFSYSLNPNAALRASRPPHRNGLRATTILDDVDLRFLGPGFR